MTFLLRKLSFLTIILFAFTSGALAQPQMKLKYKNSSIYAGIEVGSKGVKMSIIEVGKNARREGTYNALRDTSSNTDFISFTPATFTATNKALTGLFQTALNVYKIPTDRIYTTISSGVKVQADKEKKADWLKLLADSFRANIHEASRQVEIVDVLEEARLSHLGIVPEDRRYTTFLIDIGSGNTKGGYFPFGNEKDFKLFNLSWGTKSSANAAEKRMGDDKTISNFTKNVYRVMSGDANPEISYAVNVSNAYNMSDYVAFSGGIAWATATLMYPELIDNPVVPVTFDELVKFNDLLLKNYPAVSDKVILKSLGSQPTQMLADVESEVKRVNQVFDQKSLIAGAALLQNIMRQFTGVYEKKQFYLVKNGQVGWISAYVNQSLSQQ
jgi:hypothetical protein